MNQVMSVEGGYSAQSMSAEHPMGTGAARHEGYHYQNGQHLVHGNLKNTN